ncbi:MAG: hypothetical protein ACE5EC_03970 [Phycisphaerae bacterium]
MRKATINSNPGRTPPSSFTLLAITISLGVLAGSDGNCAGGFDSVLCDADVNAPAPAVDGIEFHLVEKYTSTTGRIQVLGVVENKGLAAYVSDAGKQKVQLFEGSTMVAEQGFQNLQPGEMIGVSYLRDWDTEGEFFLNYRAVIVYDPDNALDANPLNNDCEFSDNELEVNASKADELFQ